MRQLAPVNVLRGGIELGDRLGHAAGQPHADIERDQLDYAEENSDAQQPVDEDAGVLAQAAEQRPVEHRRPRIDQQQSA